MYWLNLGKYIAINFNINQQVTTMYANQMLALLQADKFYLIKVRFKHHSINSKAVYLEQYGKVPLSEKTYTYKVPHFVGLTIEDEVIVDSPFNGMVVVKVVEVIEEGIAFDQDFNNSKGYKWIVQKVCPQQYHKQLEKEAQAEKLLKQHLTNQAKEKAMANIKAMFDEPALEQITKALN